MSTTIQCTIAEQKVSVTENGIKTNCPILQIELIKRLIECKSAVAPTESALPLFYNKYLRHYPISEINFLENTSKKGFVKIEYWDVNTSAAA